MSICGINAPSAGWRSDDELKHEFPFSTVQKNFNALSYASTMIESGCVQAYLTESL